MADPPKDKKDQKPDDQPTADTAPTEGTGENNTSTTSGQVSFSREQLESLRRRLKAKYH